MKQYKSTLTVGTQEIDYMIHESENLIEAGKYAEGRFDNAYPQYSNIKGSHLHTEEV